MKPLVSSIVALAIAIAPAYAMAAEKHGKPVAAKVAKHKKKHKDDSDKADKDKSDKSDKGVVTVRHTGKDKPSLHNTRMEGHKGEPKVDHGVTVIPASMTTKAPSTKKVDPPKLPSTDKPGKHASEKGGKKATKKHDDSPKDGQPERDEDIAELVARIRGNHARAGETKPTQVADKADKDAKTKHLENAKCYKDAIEIIRGAEVEKLSLMKCDGTIAPLAVEQLSILVRPGDAARPTTPLEELAKKKGPEIAKGVRRVDTRLVDRLQSIVDHFAKSGSTTKLDVISGYRPTSVGSMHSSGRAIDFRLEGVDNDKLIAFCKTLDDTGCGFYPNSSFVHVDVRDPGAGHVTWTDASEPGATPRYVTVWPPPKSHTKSDDEDKGIDRASLKKLDSESAPDPVDSHPSELPPLGR